jgi:hypothetical protein
MKFVIGNETAPQDENLRPGSSAEVALAVEFSAQPVA